MNINIPGVKPESTLESLYKTIGFIVVQWGHCEQSLETIVHTLHMDYGGNKLPNRKKMPRQLKEKISFARECAANIPAISPFRVNLENLLDVFDVISKRRHDLIHGSLLSFDDDNGAFDFIRLQTHPDTHEIKEFTYDLKAFPFFLKDLLRLGEDAPKLARLIFDARPEQS